MGITFIAVAYFAAVFLLLFKVKPIWGKVLVLIAAILIPNADDWYYRHQLANYCKNEAGVKVYQQATRQGGLLIGPQSGGDKFYVKLYSIAFTESPETVNGKTVSYWRTDRLSDGISDPYRISIPTALYEKKRIVVEQDPFDEISEQIVDRKTGAILGEFKGLFYYGSWYPRVLVGKGGLVAACGKNGQVIPHAKWQGHDANGYSINEVVDQVFSKE